MTSQSAYFQAGIHLIDQNLVVSMAEELDDFDLVTIQKQILNKMERSFVQGVLFDVSKVLVLDSTLFSILVETSKMIELLGGKAIFVGFSSQVASSLVELELDFESIETAVTMDDGLDQLRLINDLPEKDTQEGLLEKHEQFDWNDSVAKHEDREGSG